MIQAQLALDVKGLKVSVLFTRICTPTESFCHMDNTNIYHQINFCKNNGAALAPEIQKELRRCFF